VDYASDKFHVVSMLDRVGQLGGKWRIADGKGESDPFSYSELRRW
jgi:hypothetical protein